MIQATHFINKEDGAFVKAVPQLIPNLLPGNCICLMKDKDHGYEVHRYEILRVETVIGDCYYSILQDVLVKDLGMVNDKPLVAKTEDQRRHIEEILCDVNYVDMSEHGDVEVFIDGTISYDKMAEVVDYLKNGNRND